MKNIKTSYFFILFSTLFFLGSFIQGSCSETKAEPVIQGLYLYESLTLKDQSIILNERLAPNQDITTQAGMQRFFSNNDGVMINKDGLYRISFYQRVFTRAEKSKCIVFLMVTPGNYYQRYQVVTMEPDSSGEINFTQIVKIKAGEKLQIVLRPVFGEIVLGPNFNSSGLTLEEIN